MLVENCKGCKYFLDVQQNIGTCRRFPHYQNRSPNEVCGEFFGKAVAEVRPEILGTFLPVRQEAEIVDRAKRRGRPPKEKA